MAVKSRQARPSLAMELEEVESFGGPVAGVDEAGRGPLAGPVVAAAVMLQEDDVCQPDRKLLRQLNDSKVLSEAVREELYEVVVGSFAWGVGVADVRRIDRCNILRATMWAMQRAVAALPCPPSSVLIDGNRAPEMPCRSQTVVKGDARCLSIAAASIVAKVTRDRMMREIAGSYPEFGFAKHKGYGTKEHLEAIQRFGVTPHHRRSFKPIMDALARADNCTGCGHG